MNEWGRSMAIVLVKMFVKYYFYKEYVSKCGLSRRGGRRHSVVEI